MRHLTVYLHIKEEYIVAEITNKQKLATVGYVEAILHKLQDWMPFKRKNGAILQDSKDENGEQTLQTTNTGEIALGKYNTSGVETLLSIGIGSREERKNAISIKQNGEIFIITNIQNYKVESLQSILDKKGVTILNDESELDEYKTFENIGRMFYINNEFGALYVISYKTPSGYDAFKIGDSIETDLSNYYTKEEVYTKEQVRALIDEIKAGGIDLANYYTILQVDEKVEALQEQIDNIDGRLNFVEDVIETPISTEDLESIIGLDINNDGKIGK